MNLQATLLLMLRCGGPGSGRHKTVAEDAAKSFGLRFNIRESKHRGIVAELIKSGKGEVGEVAMAPHPTDPKSMYIAEAGIHPDYRHQGLGPKMYAALFEHAQEHGKHKVYSSPNNYRTPEAKKAWQRFKEAKVWNVKSEKGRPYVDLKT